MSSKFHLSKWKTCFSQFIDKFLKIEEVEYLIHYAKLKMWPALFYVSSQHFSMLVLGCTLFTPIDREIENWDFECCSRLDFPTFHMMREVKNWSFLDCALLGKRELSCLSVYAVYAFISYASRKKRSLFFLSSKQRIFWYWIHSFSVCQQIHKKSTHC